MEINSLQHYASLMKSTTPGLLESCCYQQQQQQQQYRLLNHDDAQLPPGFRFHPTDEELITCYLMRKVVDGNFTSRAIAEIDLNKCEPWELPGKAKMGEGEWYFFSLRDRKYPTGLRTNRATESGYWKATGKDREVLSSKRNQRVGMKKTLVFYRGRAPKGEKTNWVMHEYRLEGSIDYQILPCSTKDEWVVCRVFQKIGGVVGAGNNKKSQRTALPVGHVAASFSDTWVDDHHHSTAPAPASAPASLPMLLDTSAEGVDRICSFETSGRDHVSCFSTAQAITVPNPPYLFSPVAAPPPGLGVSGTGVAPPFPTMRSLRENHPQMPFFFSSAAAPPLPPFDPSRVEAAVVGAGNWSAALDTMDRKVAPDANGSRRFPVGATELDYMVTY